MFHFIINYFFFFHQKNKSVLLPVFSLAFDSSNSLQAESKVVLI